MKDGYKIGEAAKKTGVSSDTLRYYDKFGLLKPQKSSSGFRCYDSHTMSKIIFIRNAKQLGFSLNEIKELLDLKVNTQTKAKHVRDKTEAKFKQILKKKTDLTAIENVLQQLIRSCDKPEASALECPILLALQNFDLSSLEKSFLKESKKQTQTRRK